MIRTRCRILSVALALGALLVSAPAPARAQAGAETGPLEPADIFDLETVADPQISPDGEWVAYVRQRADVMTDRRFSNLWIVRTDGTGHRPLTTGDHSEGSPRWSPDGGRLDFVSNRGGSPQIHVASAICRM